MFLKEGVYTSSINRRELSKWATNLSKHSKCSWGCILNFSKIFVTNRGTSIAVQKAQIQKHPYFCEGCWYEPKMWCATTICPQVALNRSLVPCQHFLFWSSSLFFASRLSRKIWKFVNFAKFAYFCCFYPSSGKMSENCELLYGEPPSNQVLQFLRYVLLRKCKRLLRVCRIFWEKIGCDRVWCECYTKGTSSKLQLFSREVLIWFQHLLRTSYR